MTFLRRARVKMCSEVNMKDLMAAHHNLGLLHYYMQYRHLPHVLRQDANPGEAGGPSVPYLASLLHGIQCTLAPLCLPTTVARLPRHSFTALHSNYKTNNLSVHVSSS